jgi:hypothetical protein
VDRRTRLWVRFWGLGVGGLYMFNGCKTGLGVRGYGTLRMHNSHPSSSSSTPRIEDFYYEIVPLANFDHQRALRLLARMQLQYV